MEADEAAALPGSHIQQVGFANLGRNVLRNLMGSFAFCKGFSPAQKPYSDLLIAFCQPNCH